MSFGLQQGPGIRLELAYFITKSPKTMTRKPVFDTPHKALRLAFAELTTLAGKTDFYNISAVQALQKLMGDVFTLVYSHSHHEDEICFEELDQRCPNATQHDRDEHQRLHQRLDELNAKAHLMVEELRAGQDQSEEGEALHTRLCNLQAEMLIHMMEEERDTQPLVWKYLSDEEVAAQEARILSSMEPQIMALWTPYIIGSQPLKQVQEMFKGMQVSAPAFVMEGNLKVARQRLSTAEYAQLEAVLELN
jgi:iron-sulfur cluster repair protein YtfE (RIC family)